MKKQSLICLLMLMISFISWNQHYNKFEGKLVYNIYAKDTSMRKFIPNRTMTVFTNDTITRIENYSPQFGTQVLMKHLFLNKSILLLEANNNYFAIQTDLNKKDSTANSKSANYLIKKKRGKVIVAGKEARQVIINYPETKSSFTLYYYKGINPNYIDAFSNSPGLPVKYEVETADGILIYELSSMDSEVLNKDLFGVPSNYKKVTFNQFLNEVLNQNNIQKSK